MSSLDHSYWPFTPYAGYSSMAPCIRSCDNSQAYNGCDAARCWCNKGNLDIRMGSMTRCASSKCTFANMNTQTDLDVLSVAQISYCMDKGFSPADMTMPSTAQATPTRSSGPVSSGAGLTTRSNPTSGPVATNSPYSGSSTNVGSSLLGTAAKIGIGIGGAFCVLLVVTIILLVRRRPKPQTHHPQYDPPAYQPPMQPNFQNGPPPNMPSTPFSGNGPFSPPLQHPAPLHIPQQQNYTRDDVSPIEEKSAAVTVSRKEVGSGGTKSALSSPTPTPATPAPVARSPPRRQAMPHQDNGPREVHGSVPPPRHEVSNDGQITNTVTTRGMELDSSQQPPIQQYQPPHPQGQWGYNYPHAQELPGGYAQNHAQQRQELPGGYAPGQQQRQEMPGGQGQGQPYGGAYELGPGR